MTERRRSGRHQRLAYDDTPLHSRDVDVDARIGWLLAVSRLHHPDPEVADGVRFVRALGDAGFRASRSAVSRWESGEIPVSFAAMSAYERALGLTEGRLSSLTGYVRAAIPGVRVRVSRPQLDASSAAFAERLDALVERAEDGHAHGADWQALGWHLSAAPLVHLRAHTWARLCRRLVAQLPRAVKVAYRQYSVAAMNIASLHRAQEHLTDAVAEHLGTPGVQVVNNPLGLLDRLPTRRAATMVLDLVEDPPDESTRSQAVWVAAQKVAHGHFTDDERARLDMLVLRRWRARPTRAAEELAELIASLPEGMRSTLRDAAVKAGRRTAGYAVEYGEDLAPELATELSEWVARIARERAPGAPTYDQNPMLVRLVREALSHRDSERRHLASLLISASPFGPGVTDALLTLLSDAGTPQLARARAATLVRYLGEDEHRMRMLRVLDDPDDAVAGPVVQGIGHLRFADFSDQAVRATLQRDWSPRERAKMYALGMSGSPGLDALARSSRAPAWQREAATWWLEAGPAVHD